VTAPNELVTSTVIPITNRKGLNSTDYQGIALSSIYGKICYLIVLQKFCDQLCILSLQFGFKAKRSRSMCTVVLKEVIAYYLTHGSLYCTMLDATKAFDRANYCRLFRDLLDRDLPREYLRLMLNMYICYKLEWTRYFESKWISFDANWHNWSVGKGMKWSTSGFRGSKVKVTRVQRWI